MTGPMLLLVFVGGGAGATCRYGVGRFVGLRYGGAFPLGTFLINVTGCFALGLLASLVALTRRDQAALTALLATGFLGGYTTFSTYALESVLLYIDGSRRMALTNLFGSVVAALCAAAAGAGRGPPGMTGGIMRRLLLVFVGGGCGACLRALLLAWLQPWGVSLPVPVLLANLLGAFLLGVVSVLADEAVTVDAGGRGDWPGPARRLGVRDVHHQAAYSRGV